MNNGNEVLSGCAVRAAIQQDKAKPSKDFEAWFKSEYPLYNPDKNPDVILKQRLRDAWGAGIAAFTATL